MLRTMTIETMMIVLTKTKIVTNTTKLQLMNAASTMTIDYSGKYGHSEHYDHYGNHDIHDNHA